MIGTQKTECLVLQTREPDPIETPVIVQRVEEGEKLASIHDGLDRLSEELKACEEYGISHRLAPSYTSMSLKHIRRIARKNSENAIREPRRRWDR